MKAIPLRPIRLAILAAIAVASGCGEIDIGINGADSGLGAGGRPASVEPGTAGSGAVGGSSGQSSSGGSLFGMNTSGAAGSLAGGASGSAGGGASGHFELAGAAGDFAGAAGQAAGAAGQVDGPTCSEPDGAWQGCFAGQPCFVCAAEIASYPLYLHRHPRCTSWYACDHGPQSACSSDCPPPGDADQCDGTPGNWSGCRGLGCYVCTELVAGFPKYFANHPFCISNGTCEGEYFTCSAACPEPTEADL